MPIDKRIADSVSKYDCEEISEAIVLVRKSDCKAILPLHQKLLKQSNFLVKYRSNSLLMTSEELLIFYELALQGDNIALLILFLQAVVGNRKALALVAELARIEIAKQIGNAHSRDGIATRLIIELSKPGKKSKCDTFEQARSDAFEHLVRLYNKFVYYRLSRLLFIHKLNRSDLEDLVQQTWLRVWKSLRSFRGNSRFSTWLWVIATRVFYDHFHFLATNPPPRPPRPPTGMAIIELHDMFIIVLQVLETVGSAKKVEAFVLVKIHGFSRKEVAAIMHVAEKTIQRWIQEVEVVLELNDTIRKWLKEGI